MSNNKLTDRKIAEILARAEICDDSVLTDYTDIAAAMRELQERRRLDGIQHAVCEVCGVPCNNPNHPQMAVAHEHSAQPVPVVPEECPAELPYAQVKAAADLYALCWQSGEVVTYTPDPEKATIWLNNYSGTCVQEYVKLERLQEALSGYSPVIPRVYLADINTDHQH
ncbi:Eaa protein [Salmonella enterica]|nr:Eaa protein [Salmonella enterica]